MKNVNESVDFDSIWKQYQNNLKRFLHSKVSNSSDVDDLFQDIMLKTHQNLVTVKDTTSIKPWLYQIANRTIIDFYRKNARQQRLADVDASELWFEQEPESIEQAMSECVAPFVQALPTQSRELMKAIELKGQSQKQLADSQGIRYSTLKSRVQKSRNELKQLFEDCCSFSFDRQGNMIECNEKSKGCSKC
ncbi:RNA polymerase sigma factor SigZ [Vibrio sp. TRT 17S01]|uniref:RNA polymerase sigma factor SigZ n=1 Tax=Vibrio sp. TRT 17S01 TaxID=3418505 RepID=UPI003CE6BC0B